MSNATETRNSGLTLLKSITAEPTLLVDGDVIDLIAIERRLAGARPQPDLTRAEQQWTARTLAAAGVSRGVITDRLGISGATLRQMLGEPPKPRAALKPCGTPAAYYRHHRRKEPIDQACLEAYRERRQQLLCRQPRKAAA